MSLKMRKLHRAFSAVAKKHVIVLYIFGFFSVYLLWDYLLSPGTSHDATATVQPKFDGTYHRKAQEKLPRTSLAGFLKPVKLRRAVRVVPNGASERNPNVPHRKKRGKAAVPGIKPVMLKAGLGRGSKRNAKMLPRKMRRKAAIPDVKPVMLKAGMGQGAQRHHQRKLVKKPKGKREDLFSWKNKHKKQPNLSEQVLCSTKGHHFLRTLIANLPVEKPAKKLFHSSGDYLNWVYGLYLKSNSSRQSKQQSVLAIHPSYWCPTWPRDKTTRVRERCQDVIKQRHKRSSTHQEEVCRSLVFSQYQNKPRRDSFLVRHWEGDLGEQQRSGSFNMKTYVAKRKTI